MNFSQENKETCSHVYNGQDIPQGIELNFQVTFSKLIKLLVTIENQSIGKPEQIQTKAFVWNNNNFY